MNQCIVTLRCVYVVLRVDSASTGNKTERSVPDELHPVHSPEYTPPLPFSARCNDKNSNTAIMQVVCVTKAV